MIVTDVTGAQLIEVEFIDCASVPEGHDDRRSMMFAIRELQRLGLAKTISTGSPNGFTETIGRSEVRV